MKVELLTVLSCVSGIWYAYQKGYAGRKLMVSGFYMAILTAAVFEAGEFGRRYFCRNKVDLAHPGEYEDIVCAFEVDKYKESQARNMALEEQKKMNNMALEEQKKMNNEILNIERQKAQDQINTNQKLIQIEGAKLDLELEKLADQKYSQLNQLQNKNTEPEQTHFSDYHVELNWHDGDVDFPLEIDYHL